MSGPSLIIPQIGTKQKNTNNQGLSDHQLVDATSLFFLYSRDGTINKQQLADLLKEYNIQKNGLFFSKKRFIKEQFELVDKEKKGQIDFEDFKILYHNLMNIEQLGTPKSKETSVKISPAVGIEPAESPSDKKRPRKTSFSFNPFSKGQSSTSANPNPNSNSSTLAPPSTKSSPLTSSLSTHALPTGQTSLLSTNKSTIGLPTAKSDKSDKKDQKFFFFNPNSTEVPTAVVYLINHIRETGLQVPGIFRISGSLTNVLELKKRLDVGKFPLPDLSSYDLHDICSTLKLWLRQMANPLLTFNLYEAFISATSINESEEERLECIRKVVKQLPVGHLVLLKFLVAFLVEVASHSEVNLMTENNIAIVFTPTCFRPQQETISELFGNSTNANSLFETFITNYDDIFMPREKTKKVVLKGSQAQYVCGTLSRATLRAASSSSSPPNSSGLGAATGGMPSWNDFFTAPDTSSATSDSPSLPDTSSSSSSVVVNEEEAADVGLGDLKELLGSQDAFALLKNRSTRERESFYAGTRHGPTNFEADTS
eukprot:TRINITY_DN6561_c0_g1_i1.p1 TRINITY_DN6561_c0_g1~~TRINITY_DN6561_c0_g1_i1.p1  ORF type:complete len:540 (+),score=132.64 TRINITY_DN6561_c0_g1_i1:67-1686(+)